ncbi:MAG: methyltransferase [Ruminococcus sp.]|nr:methyltransferase [Ruminococcus sp.]
MSVVLNDLYDYGLKIYQDSDKFKFSLDSLLLAEFVKISKNDQTLLDLCSGNAPLPLILASRTNLSITGVELQKDIYNLALESIKYNHLENRITMLNENVKVTNNYFPGNNFDIITCNPPFFKTTPTSLINTNYEKALARHELTVTIEDIFKVTSDLLKDRGKFYLVHRPERLEEIITLAHNYHLTLKSIKFIAKESESCAIMMLLFFTKNGNIGSTKISTKVINRDTKTYQNIFN